MIGTPEPTLEHKLKLLLAYGFTVGLRDGRLNTAYPGHYMVVEGAIADIERDYDLPTTDGANGPWCIVGNNLAALIEEAFDLAADFNHFPTVLADIQRGGVGILHTNGQGAGAPIGSSP